MSIEQVRNFKLFTKKLNEFKKCFNFQKQNKFYDLYQCSDALDINDSHKITTNFRPVCELNNRIVAKSYCCQIETVEPNVQIMKNSTENHVEHISHTNQSKIYQEWNYNDKGN